MLKIKLDCLYFQRLHFKLQSQLLLVLKTAYQKSNTTVNREPECDQDRATHIERVLQHQSRDSSPAFVSSH